MKMRVIGHAARLASSIPVARAQDYVRIGSGFIRIDEHDPCLVHGEHTCFATEVKLREQIVLPKAVGSLSAEVVEILSDTELRLKSEFASESGSSSARVRDAAQGARSSGKAGLEFRILPHVDQAEMFRHAHESLSNGDLIGIFPEGIRQRI
jgi:glycerol-3-phosphate O-acyltransferase / dihydroxyacetone phosphate acyltransferase